MEEGHGPPGIYFGHSRHVEDPSIRSYPVFSLTIFFIRDPGKHYLANAFKDVSVSKVSPILSKALWIMKQNKYF